MGGPFATAIEIAAGEFRYACRSLTRSAGFTVAAVMTLGLAIAVNLTMFGLLRAVLWRPLPYPNSERLMVIRTDALNVPHAGATRAEFLALEAESRSFERLGTIDGAEVNLEFAGTEERLPGASISDGMLRALGVRPQLGRLPDTRSDFASGQPTAVLISDELWRRRFAGSVDAIGKPILINDRALRIAGVLPRGWRLFLPPTVYGTEQVDVWLPQLIDPAIPYRGVAIVGRLKAGVTEASANAELRALGARFEREHPERYRGGKAWQAAPADRKPGAPVHFTAVGMRAEMTREAGKALGLLAGMVAFVLLIACVNVANLLLARGEGRGREQEIRRALGASRGRIMRQALIESMLLAAAAAALGLGGAYAGLESMKRQEAWQIPLQSRIVLDGAAVIFATVLAAGTSVVCGLLPAWRQAAGSAGEKLRAGRAQTAGARGRRWQQGLVVGEVALSIVPLAGAGLMLRSLENLLHTPLGFEPRGVMTAKIPFDVKRYPHIEQRRAMLEEVFERVQALPGVREVSAANPLPLDSQEVRRVGRADQPDTPPVLATQQFLLPGYLRVMSAPLRAGRDFTEADLAQDRPAVIIDEGLAQRLWPEGAIGKRLAVYRTGWRNEMEIVGVTASARVTRVRDRAVPHFMMPYSGYPREMAMVVKTTSNAQQVVRGIGAAVAAAHIGREAYDIRPMESYVADSIGDTRFIFWTLGTFAALAVLLAAVGLYGTLAYLTAQRTREFGIRMALGATVQGIVGIVMRESLAMAAVGTIIGVAGAAALSSMMRGVLYEVRPLDVVTLGGVVMFVSIMAVAAAGAPAWNVTKADPQDALRSE